MTIVRSMTAAVRTTTATVDHAVFRISESLFITTSMDDHDEEKRRQQNLIVRSGKSEAQVTVTLDVLYY